MTYTGTALVSKGEKHPLEDAVLADDGLQLYIVADGVTRPEQDVYPDPSPAGELAKHFVGYLKEMLIEQKAFYPTKTPAHQLYGAFSQSNNEVARINRELFGPTLERVDYGPNDLLGLVALAVHLTPGRLHYAYCGDCSAYIVRNEHVFRFGGKRAGAAKAYLSLYDWKDENRWRWSRQHLRNNTEHPAGYAAITGDIAFERFAESGTVELRGDERIVLTTDGLVPYFDDCPDALQGGAKSIMAGAVSWEREQDKHASDKGIVVIVP